MATHIYPEEGEAVEATREYLSRIEHMAAAKMVIQILEDLDDAEVRDIQFPKDSLYTCWYLSLKGYEKLPIVNFTLHAGGRMNVEFRYMQFVPPQTRDKLGWQTGNLKLPRFSGHFEKIEFYLIRRCVYVEGTSSV